MVSRILVAGDTHGNLGEMRRLFARAGDHGCHAIMVCGDFGIWPGIHGEIFQRDTNLMAEENDIDVYFVDGNHEDFDQLYAIDDFNDEGFRVVREHIFHAPRGHLWEWAGKKLGALGGAVSIDREWRVPGKSWWPQENITEADIEKSLKLPARLDVLFTHDTLVNAPFGKRLKPDLDSVANRQRVTYVVQNIAPKLMFHGHMHDDYHFWYPGDWPGGRVTEVFGLECDGMLMNWAVLDLTTMDVQLPNMNGDRNG